MAKTKPAFSSIDEYLASFPDGTQRVLERVRTIIRRALPGSQEAISYGIPVFKVGGRSVLYFAGWKEHFSLYPATGRLTTAFEKELTNYETSGKGTIRFPLADPIPGKLIGQIAKFRAKEASESDKAKPKTARKR